MSSRAAAKERARAARKESERSATEAEHRRRRLIQLGIVLLAAALIVGALIIVSQAGDDSGGPVEGGAEAAALFAGLVHVVLVAAHVSEPAASTVHGLTTRRLWATTTAVLALVGVVIGGLALVRPASRFGATSAPRGFPLGTSVALAAGLIAVVNGGLNLAIANGGPGTGNGVVGAAGALVRGLVAMAVGGLALDRSRRTG